MHPNPALPILRYFSWQHLRDERMAACSKRFADLAHALVETVPPGPELTVALRKLLESKDAAVRALLPDPAAPREIASISINGSPFLFDEGHVLTFRDVVSLARMSGTPSMTVKGFSPESEARIVTPRDSIAVTSGMIINVVHTGNA